MKSGNALKVMTLNTSTAEMKLAYTSSTSQGQLTLHRMKEEEMFMEQKRKRPKTVLHLQLLLMPQELTRSL